MEPILSVKNLFFSYNAFEALTGVSFEITKGDYVALVGPNGAGKTTLIKLILNLEESKQGSVKLFGENIRDFKNWNLIGYLPQRISNFNPLFPATIKEVVGMGLLSKKTFPRNFIKSDNEKIDQALDLMGIKNLKDNLVAEISGGQQQRVFLARALVSNPELLILDEPSSALDPQTRKNFFELIQKLNKENGITVILITHDTSQIGEYANKLLYLDKKLVFYGQFAGFCKSSEMSDYFGQLSQHLICHQHPICEHQDHHND